MSEVEFDLMLLSWLEPIAKDPKLYHQPVWQKALDHVYRTRGPTVVDNQGPPTICNMNRVNTRKEAPKAYHTANVY